MFCVSIILLIDDSYPNQETVSKIGFKKAEVKPSPWP